MNNFDDYVNAVAEAVVTRLREDSEQEVSATVEKVTKNNGVVLTGMHIIKQDNNVAPIFYMEDSYRHYQQGMPFEDVVDRLCEHYKMALENESWKEDDIPIWGKMREKVCYKLINTFSNEEVLKKVPNEKVAEDLSMVFYLYLHNSNGCVGTILINHNMIKSWGITYLELKEAALKNTPVLLPAKMKGVFACLKEMGFEELEVFFKETTNEIMYSLSNNQGLSGAAVILYPGMIESIFKVFGECYAIPSNVHEWLIVPCSRSKQSIEEFAEMIRDVNSSMCQEEVLADHVYLITKSGLEIPE